MAKAKITIKCKKRLKIQSLSMVYILLDNDFRSVGFDEEAQFTISKGTHHIEIYAPNDYAMFYSDRKFGLLETDFTVKKQEENYVFQLPLIGLLSGQLKKM